MEILVGSDDFFSKRKQGSIRDLQRRTIHREQYAVVLIVCEGSKTEPYYFAGLCKELGLNRANIVIQHCKSGSDPVSIVKYAIEEYNKHKDYDQVYCVFDKEHANYQEALDKIDVLRNKLPIHAIQSVPCFEYWLLLHFDDTSKPYQQKGNKSAGDQLKSELKKYIKNYHESDKDVFEKTKMLLSLAINRAKKIDKLQEKNGTDNPSTKIYRLVEYLIEIKRE